MTCISIFHTGSVKTSSQPFQKVQTGQKQLVGSSLAEKANPTQQLFTEVQGWPTYCPFAFFCPLSVLKMHFNFVNNLENKLAKIVKLIGQTSDFSMKYCIIFLMRPFYLLLEIFKLRKFCLMGKMPSKVILSIILPLHQIGFLFINHKKTQV